MPWFRGMDCPPRFRDPVVDHRVDWLELGSCEWLESEGNSLRYPILSAGAPPSIAYTQARRSNCPAKEGGQEEEHREASVIHYPFRTSA